MTHQPSTASTHSHHVADVARKHSTASVGSHHVEEPAASKTRSGSIHGDPRSSVRERHASHEDEPPTQSFSSQTSYGNHKADGTDAPLKRRSDRAQTVDPRAALRGRLEPETSEPIASRKAGRHNTTGGRGRSPKDASNDMPKRSQSGPLKKKASTASVGGPGGAAFPKPPPPSPADALTAETAGAAAQDDEEEGEGDEDYDYDYDYNEEGAEEEAPEADLEV